MSKLEKVRADMGKRVINLVTKRSYDGARTDRRSNGWVAAGSSANSEILPQLSILRNRSRELVRNNPYASKAMRVLSSNRIGTGIMATINDKSVAALWKKWIKACDADGQYDLYGLQKLISNTEAESGECLIRFRYRKMSDGLPVPLQLQLLEPDFIDTNKNEGLKNKGWIQNGIEFSPIGERVAYWLFNQHPGENIINTTIKSSRVPASDVIHSFDRKRPGQMRGVPVLAPVMMTAHNLNEFIEATLVRKVAESCIAAVVETDDENRSIGDESSDDQMRIEELIPGMVQYLSPGEKLTFTNPSTSQGDIGYIRDRLREFAVGCPSLTYEQLTGDLSQVNYSSIRAGTLDARREIEQWQWLSFIPSVLNRIMEKFLDTAFAAGLIQTTEIDYDWTTPRFDWVDPLKDVQGEELELTMGLKTWSEAVRARGFNPDVLLEELKAEREKFKAAGIEYPVKKEQSGFQSNPEDQNQQNESQKDIQT